MQLNEYQEQATGTAVYPAKGRIAGLNYAILALCGESGELANKLKKLIRGREIALYGFLTSEVFEAELDSKSEKDYQWILADELGDALWYIAAVANELGMTLEQVAEQNIEKLAARKQQNQIKEHA